MGAIIRNYSSRGPVPREDVSSEEFDYLFGRIGTSRDGFNPFGHIVHSNKYIQIPMGNWEWAHKIDAPYVK
jgi:hypothetical protein